MNNVSPAKIEDCILAYKHGDTSARTQRLVVDFRQVPLAKVGMLYTVSHRAESGSANWLDVVKWLTHSLQYNIIGPTNCSAALLGENHLTFELVVTTVYMDQAVASIALYLEPYGINCEFIHQ